MNEMNELLHVETSQTRHWVKKKPESGDTTDYIDPTYAKFKRGKKLTCNNLE